MVDILKKVQGYWSEEMITSQTVVSKLDLLDFQKNNNVELLDDLKEYFLFLNGTNEKYDANFYAFYDLKQFKNIPDFYKDIQGIPNYQLLNKTLENSFNYFVFADYHIDLFSYAIRLTENKIDNAVFVLCGEKYRQIAGSFSEFLELYLSNSEKLLI
ncbi:MAG: hypothetical protein ACI8ZM_005484 [Crocinitomix sp.]|jgi:hypothetical protein